MKAEAKAKDNSSLTIHNSLSLTICYSHLLLTTHNSQLTTDRMHKPTPWTRIYVLILLYNAILVVLFFLIRQYFNIN